MNIRPFTPEDITQIISLTNEYASFDSDVTAADFSSAHAFPQGLLVAEAAGRIVAFIFGYIKEVPGTILNRWNAQKAAQINLLVVEPPYRRQGTGETLMRKLEDAFREEDVDLILLHCPAEATEAKHLYDKLGFEVRAYAMKKRL